MKFPVHLALLLGTAIVFSQGVVAQDQARTALHAEPTSSGQTNQSMALERVSCEDIRSGSHPLLRMLDTRNAAIVFGVPLPEWSKMDWVLFRDRLDQCSAAAGQSASDRASQRDFIDYRLKSAPDPDGRYKTYQEEQAMFKAAAARERALDAEIENREVQEREAAMRARRHEQQRVEDEAIESAIRPLQPLPNTRDPVDCSDKFLLDTVGQILSKSYSILKLYGANPNPSYTVANRQLSRGTETLDPFTKSMFEAIPQCDVSAVTANGNLVFSFRVFQVEADKFIEVTPKEY